MSGFGSRLLNLRGKEERADMPQRGLRKRRAINDNRPERAPDAVPWLEVTLIAAVLASGVVAGGVAFAKLWHQTDSERVVPSQ